MKTRESKVTSITQRFHSPEVTVNPDGTISIPATEFWEQGKKYDMPAIDNEPFPEGSRLLIEKTPEGVGYFLDTTGLAVPVSFGEGIGARKVCWWQDGEIIVFRSYRT